MNNEIQLTYKDVQDRFTRQGKVIQHSMRNRILIDSLQPDTETL